MVRSGESLASSLRATLNASCGLSALTWSSQSNISATCVGSGQCPERLVNPSTMLILIFL